MNSVIVDSMMFVCKDDESIRCMIDKVCAMYNVWKKSKIHDGIWSIITKNNEHIWFIKSEVLYPVDQFRGWRVKLCFIQDECYTKEINKICLPHIHNIMEGGLTGWIEPQIFEVRN